MYPSPSSAHGHVHSVDLCHLSNTSPTCDLPRVSFARSHCEWSCAKFGAKIRAKIRKVSGISRRECAHLIAFHQMNFTEERIKKSKFVKHSVSLLGFKKRALQTNKKERGVGPLISFFWNPRCFEKVQKLYKSFETYRTEFTRRRKERTLATTAAAYDPTTGTRFAFRESTK